MTIDEATGEGIDGGIDSIDGSVTSSGEDADVGEESRDTAAGVGVLSAGSGLGLPGGKDTVITSSLSLPTGSREGVGGGGCEGCAGACTTTSEHVPGSLTR